MCDVHTTDTTGNRHINLPMVLQSDRFCRPILHLVVDCIESNLRRNPRHPPRTRRPHALKTLYLSRVYIHHFHASVHIHLAHTRVTPLQCLLPDLSGLCRTDTRGGDICMQQRACSPPLHSTLAENCFVLKPFFSILPSQPSYAQS